MNNKISMIEEAYKILEKGKELTFKELFDAICKELKITAEEREKRINDFYTEFTLDGRFSFLKDTQKWGLTKNYSYKVGHIEESEINLVNNETEITQEQEKKIEDDENDSDDNEDDESAEGTDSKKDSEDAKVEEDQ